MHGDYYIYIFLYHVLVCESSFHSGLKRNSPIWSRRIKCSASRHLLYLQPEEHYLHAPKQPSFRWYALSKSVVHLFMVGSTALNAESMNICANRERQTVETPSTVKRRWRRLAEFCHFYYHILLFIYDWPKKLCRIWVLLQIAQRRWRLRRSHRNHSTRNNRYTATVEVISLCENPDCLRLHACWSWIFLCPGEPGLAHQMHLTWSWICWGKAHCSLRHIQVSSPLEIIWGGEDQRFRSHNPKHRLRHRGASLLPYL